MTDTPPPAKKSNTVKILLGCGLLALLLLVGGGVTAYFVFKDAMMLDPAKVEALAGDINEAAAPDGFVGDFGLDILGIKVAVMRSDSGHVMVLGSCVKAQVSELERQMDDNFDREMSKGGGSTEDLGTESIEVAGAQVEFRKVRTADGSGSSATMLRYTGTLAERDGRVSMVIYQGPEEGFDKATLVAYLKSIPAAGPAAGK